MFGDSNAAQVNHYVCIDDAASRHSADLLGGILTVRGGPAATACTSSTVRLSADPAAQSLGLPPARPRIEVSYPK